MAREIKGGVIEISTHVTHRNEIVADMRTYVPYDVEGPVSLGLDPTVGRV